MTTTRFTQLRKVMIFLMALLSIGVSAQNNYVATGPSSTTPGFLNTIVGVSAGQNMAMSARNNTFVGFKAGLSNTSGIANVFVGSEAGSGNTTGLGNMFLGQQTGTSNTTGNYNLFIGNSSGSSNISGAGNTAIGDGSLLHNTIGQRNAAIGQYAGVESTGDENVFVGFGADVSSSGLNLTNATAIGSRARVSQSNSIVLGASANVGIGTSAPQNKLEINTGVTNSSGLRFTSLTSESSSVVSLAVTLANPIVKVLTVNSSGDVVLAGLSVNLSALGGRLGADTWQTQGKYLQNTSQEGVIIGSGVTKTPSDYNLFVSKGILTERVKVAIKNTNEWADYVFSDSYKLRSLSEVETYIRQNKHLPGVPSAEEVSQQGIDVGKMDAKLLEKIEELTLYMLELKKENQEMKKAMNELTKNKNE